MKTTPLLLPLLGLLVLASSCQTYDFEPVSPFAATQFTAEVELEAKPPVPNIMILLDKSGSMEAEYVDCATPPCPTRMRALRDAMNAFLDVTTLVVSEKDQRPLAKFGLTVFPATECEPADETAVAFASSDETIALQNDINSIRDRIVNPANPAYINANGGTPTAASLEYLLNKVPEFQPENQDKFRKNYVLLLTDGLPNCNEYPNECPPLQCICTTSTPTQPVTAECEETASSACSSQPLNCLDKKTTVEAVEKLRARSIETIVIGFGADTAGGLGYEVLNELAQAGSSLKKCEENADPKSCPAFYPAADAAELGAALREIIGAINDEACTFKLAAKPASKALLSVSVGGNRIEEGDDTYEYDEENNAVLFKGNTCMRLENSSPSNPLHLKIAILKSLDD